MKREGHLSQQLAVRFQHSPHQLRDKRLALCNQSSDKNLLEAYQVKPTRPVPFIRQVPTLLTVRSSTLLHPSQGNLPMQPRQVYGSANAGVHILSLS
jgi:hypothetical protein